MARRSGSRCSCSWQEALWGTVAALAQARAMVSRDGVAVSAELIGTIISSGSLLMTLVGVLWRLSARLQSVDAAIARQSDALERVDAELQSIKRALADATAARQSIWVETNALRERLARLEERVKL